jgi:hypothetical protein
MEKQKHAPLSRIREAIRDFRAIRFHYDGRAYTVEPRELGRSTGGSFLLKALVLQGPPDGPQGMAHFHYWRIRGLQILPDRFDPEPTRAAGQPLAA